MNTIITDPRILLHTRAQYDHYKDEARRFCHERLEYYNEYYQLEYNRVSIKKLKTRWGSCSSKKNLNFNYRIIFLPSDVADYIIVHELCHLKELNHSKTFWTLVAEQFPNHKELRHRLMHVR